MSDLFLDFRLNNHQYTETLMLFVEHQQFFLNTNLFPEGTKKGKKEFLFVCFNHQAIIFRRKKKEIEAQLFLPSEEIT